MVQQFAGAAAAVCIVITKERYFGAYLSGVSPALWYNYPQMFSRFCTSNTIILLYIGIIQQQYVSFVICGYTWAYICVVIMDFTTLNTTVMPPDKSVLQVLHPSEPQSTAVMSASVLHYNTVLLLMFVSLLCNVTQVWGNESDGQCDELRLKSTPATDSENGTYINLRAHGGSLDFENTKVRTLEHNVQAM